MTEEEAFEYLETHDYDTLDELLADAERARAHQIVAAALRHLQVLRSRVNEAHSILSLPLDNPGPPK